MCDLSDDDVRQLLQARLLPEANGPIDLSAERRDELSTMLSGIVDDQYEALDSGDWEGFSKLSLDFHRAFVVAGSNRYLIDFYDQIRDRLAAMLNRRQSVVQSRAESLIAEHRSLVAAMKCGDREVFFECLRAHFGETHPPDVVLVESGSQADNA